MTLAHAEPAVAPTTSPRPVILNCAKGGIGNQLFQHVFARSLARRVGADLVTDLSAFDHDPYGRQAWVWSLAGETRTGTVAQHAGEGCFVLKEGQIQSLEQLPQMPQGVRTLVLTGYWQRDSLLDAKVVEETYAQLARRAGGMVSAELALQIQGSADAIAVHIRRGDYGHMGLCKDSYYLAAIENLKLNHPQAELFVFSDEPNYARHLLLSAGHAFTPVASGSDLGDLYLMSLCQHFVIANSSYSWWAARFGEHKGGTVICPKEWVTIDATPSPCPARWVQVAGAVHPFKLDAAELAASAQKLQKQRFDDAIRAWFATRGDQTLRLEFPELDADSTVLDLGGYKGDWTAEIHQRYGSNVYVFEPIKGYHDNICARFAAHPKVKPCQFGLGAQDATLDMGHSADGTGAFMKASVSESVTLVEAAKFLREHRIERIDLLKINIEGGEYDLLEHLIETGDIKKVRRLQVQFHDFVPNAIALRASIVEKLQATHRQSWCYYFVWEEWKLAE
ncbi:FkbM family methyltransferase [Piscinibacter sp. HJYY11]|uniref:FkbM family methyltransferase n=1 Tax=Piscinibacter sp. HJYY11 TaxID=2801333 RepID=UPI00191FBD19|nr:FkbM family methyltransferase [Piscinibacter sp. HJYY11]MBL0727342.1 FkbM family methyltransferase [Piscinibacter sp. HJYY11]